MLKLRLLTGPRAGRQLRVSDTKPVSIGRRKGRLRLHDSRVSKNHAEISFDNDAWLIRDLGSANGTYVNRKKTEGLVELESGDMVQIGRVLIKIVRCDGIAMDTQPALSDELLDDALGLGAAMDMPGQDEDDFDLDAMFDDSPSPDPGEAPDDMPEVAEPVEPPAESEPEDEDEAEADEPMPEPIEVAFDEPVDDDDSFFADRGEATDTTDGVDVAVEPEQLDEPQSEEEDPFRGGQEEQEDEPHDTSDQISLDDESGMGPSSAGTTLLTTVPHDELVIDEDEASNGELFGADEAVQDVDEGTEDAEDVEDEAPAGVGLHLEHAPPLQPELETAEEDEPEFVEEEQPDSVQEDEVQALTEAASTTGEQEQVDQESELSQPPESSDADELEVEPEAPEPEIIAEPELDAQGLEGAPEFDIDAAFDALSEGLDDSFEVPAINGELPDASEPAADALQEPAAEPKADEPVNSDVPDSLVGSQLDVGFIQDALSKLEDSETAEQEPPADDTSPKASAAPTPPTMPPAAPPAPPSVQHPPPGINPSSINPPAEPRRTYPPRDAGPGMGRWFVLLLLFVSIGGVGGWLISENYDKLITGRDEIGSPAPGSPTNPANPAIAESPGPGTDPTGPADTPPAIAQPDPPAPTQPTGPDPFAEGPGVLGPDALQGITRDSDPSRPLDPPQPPSTTDPTTPGPIVAQPVFPETITPPNNPTASDPQATTPDIDDTNPAVVEPPARIVFLIDASGSLVDSLPQMVVWLNEALQTVESDERFAVYFFKADKPIAVKPAGMLKPSRELLGQLRKDWLDPDAVPVFPSGRSNPAKAIAQAMTHKPTDLYLLSDDAFAMHAAGVTTPQAIDLVTQALGDNKVRIHGVQFFYRGENNILETLAEQTDGTFEFVRERVVPDSEPIDLLEELGGE